MLLFIICLIESLLNNLTWKDLFSYTDEEVGSQCCILGLYQGKADAFVQAYAVVAGGYFADYGAICKFYGVTMARDCPIKDLDAD